MEPDTTTDLSSEQLIERVNALYHDLQASAFDAVHERRHRIEGLFWKNHVAAKLAGTKLGVDLCTGTGFVPSVLMPRIDASTKMLCIDLSGKALQTAKARLGDHAQRVTFHTGSASEIPLADGAADWVAMNAGLHHIPNPPAVLAEIDRVLAPGGLFCLGHEPNAAFFSSRFLFRLERLIWHLHWYLSPVRNWGRLMRKCGCQVEQYETLEHLDAINDTLIREGLIETPLTTPQLRKIVDVHTHSDDEGHKAGFDAVELVERNFPTFKVEAAVFVDYGGDMMRKHLWARAGFDALMCRLFPGKGRLFSLILRKPEGGEAS